VQERESRLAALDEMVAAGLKDIDEGRTISAEDVFAELRAKFVPQKQ
jgi:antitoxin ParD1/3/4